MQKILKGSLISSDTICKRWKVVNQMRIELNNQISSEINKNKNIKKSSETASAKPLARVDSSTISSNAKQMSEASINTSALESRIAAAEETRAAKIHEVKQRIEEGYYNTPEFNDKLAEKMVSIFK